MAKSCFWRYSRKYIYKASFLYNVIHIRLALNKLINLWKELNTQAKQIRNILFQTLKKSRTEENI